MAEDIHIRGAEGGLRGRELEVMLAQAVEGRTHGIGVSRRVRVEADDIVEVGSHLVQARCKLGDNLDEPPG